MLPMVIGLLVTSIVSGTRRRPDRPVQDLPDRRVARDGRRACTCCRDWTRTRRYWPMAVAMLVLGVGIGLSMQVLTIVVQNTVDYRDLGVATSGVTFFRTLGSSFGAAVFGTVYANVLSDTLPGGGRRLARRRPGRGGHARRRCTPTRPTQIAPIVDAYAHALHVVFLAAVPVAAVAFVLALFLKEVPLRGTARAAAADLGEGFGMPEGARRAGQLQIAIARLFRRQGPRGTAGGPRAVRHRARRRRRLVRRPGAPARPGAWRTPPRGDQPARAGAGAGPRPGVPGRPRPRIPHRRRRRASVSPSSGRDELDKLTAAIRAWLAASSPTGAPTTTSCSRER